MVERTIQEQIIREAPEIEALKLGLLGSGKSLADIPIQLPEQRIADFSTLQQAAFDRAQAEGGIGGYQPYLTTGAATLGTGLGTLGAAAGTMGQAGAPLQQAQQALYGSAGRFTGGPGYTATGYGGGPGYEAGGFDPQSVSAYMDPYEDAVVQQAMSDIQRQGDIAQQGLSAQAVGAGAFGGSRQGIQQNELNRNILEQQARTAAALRSAGYQGAVGQAQQAFENQQRRQQAQAQFGTQTGLQSFEEQQRRQQAQAQFGTQSQQQAFENQQRRQQQMAQLYGGIGQLYGGLGAQQAGVGAQQAAIGGQQLGAGQFAQTAGLKDLAVMQQFGQQQQALQQSVLDAERGNLQRQLYEPYSRVAFLSDIYKGAPSSTQTLGSQVAPTPPQPSMFQQIGGLGAGLLGTAAAAKQMGGLFS
jgi:hypothetical protein